MRVYLDYNSTTPLHPAVREQIPEWLEWYANPSSYHQEGRWLRNQLELARQSIAAQLDATGHEVIFAASASEVNSWMFSHLVNRARLRHPDRAARIVINATEHPSVIEAAEAWRAQGVHVEEWPVDDQGRLKLDAMDTLLSEDLDGLFLMRVNNETGVVFPVETVASRCRELGVRIHCDAVQSLGKRPLSFEKLNVDTMVVAGHKAYAPKGLAVLVVRRGLGIQPWIHGFQENGKHAGTENLLAVMGLKTSLEHMLPELESHLDRIGQLRRKLVDQIQESIESVRLNTPLDDSVPNTLNLSFHLLEGQAVMLELDRKGIAVSTGSACHATQNDISHVIRAMEMDPLFERGNIRVSLGLPTTEADIEALTDALPDVVKQLGGVL